MKLKQNFTTPAQSSTLLAIGVPAASADCYFYDWAWNGEEHCGTAIQVCHRSDFLNERESHITHMIYPYWSAGRLIEIYELVTGKSYDDVLDDGCTLIERLLFAIIDAAHRFDFSKLD